MYPIRRFQRVRSALVVAAVLGSLFVSSAVRAGDEHRHSQDASLFSEAEYMKNIEYLASDALEGRGTGQEGIDKAGEYIVSQFKKLGVKPAGDDGTYYQNFTLKLKNKVVEGTRLAYGTPGKIGRKNAKLNQDYTPLPFSKNGDFKGEVVFAGYGLSDDDYDDYAGMDVAGKIVLVFRRSPQFREFGMMRSSFRAKASKAAAQNAAAILIVNPSFDEEGDKLFDFNSDNFGGGMMMGRQGYGVPMVQIRRDLADRLLKAGGLKGLEALEKKIESGQKPCSAALKGVTVRGTVNIEPVETPVRNIVGIIPGTGPQKDEMILLGGHYDHLGIRHKGEPGFDAKKDISNGADDNASGTSLVMTMAKVFTQGARPNRSIVLMCFTGEELGLLGSAHFASEPTVDLDKVAAMLNFDMVGRLKDDKLEVGGMRTGGFEDMVMGLGEKYHLKIKDGGGGRGPSDHTSFYNKKIPVLFFFTGIHKQYHQPTDDVPLINGEGAVRIAKFAADIIDEIDAKEERPVFAKDTRQAAIARQTDGDEKDEPEAVAAGPGRRGPGGRMGGNRPRLGIRPDMNADAEGIVVGEVMEGGAAEKAGIKEGDRIVELNGKKVEGPMDLFGTMQDLKWGDKIKIVAMRGKNKVTMEVKFEKPAEEAVAQAGPARQTAGGAKPDAGQVKELIGMLKAALENKDGSMELSLQVDSSKPDSFEVKLKFKKQSRAEAERPREGRRSQDGRSREADSKRPNAENRGRAGRAEAEDAHGKAEKESGAAEMPPVRLGIMPTYGESEGEGYEIAGVVEGGPAARAGIKDDDRIYKIGDAKITNVYEYMDALRKYKPGQNVPVTILRDGKQIKINVKSAPQKSKEAA